MFYNGFMSKTITLNSEKKDKNNVIHYNETHLKLRFDILSEIHNSEFLLKHYHDFYEVFVCLSGKEVHYYDQNYLTTGEFNFESKTVNQWTAFIVPPRCVHYIKYINKNTKSLNIHVSAEKFLSIIENLGFTSLKDTVLATTVNSSTFDLEAFYNNIYTSHLSATKQAALNTILLTNVLSQFLIYTDTESDWMSPLMTKLNNPSYFSATIPDLIKDIGYSYSHLNKMFKNKMGKSLADYHVSCKIKYAATLLEKTDIKIIDIANMLGYSNPGFFSSIFKKQYGLTPQKYRNEKKSI